jgi:SAM-dependent methyltransferase
MGNRYDYKGTWNELAKTRADAILYVGGSTDEALVDATASDTLSYLRATVGVRGEDDVLEIGCGVGRVGRILSPLVRSWTGCDCSGKMLSHAADRLAAFPNAKNVEISGHDLRPIQDSTMDVVYSTVVFMHLDEWDRYNYVREAFRVLRPGGRFWCDNINLLTDPGWDLFETYRLTFPPEQRPTHIGKCSTPQELETYLMRAGFRDVRTRSRHLWVDAWGVKP